MQYISTHPLTFLYFSLALITLSGFGVLFLNEESILAICFFIFLFLMMAYSDSLVSTLNEQKSVIREELLASLIKGQKNAVYAKVVINHRKYELANGLASLFKDCDLQIKKALHDQ